jgi:hypothetical protein
MTELIYIMVSNGNKRLDNLVFGWKYLFGCITTLAYNQMQNKISLAGDLLEGSQKAGFLDPIEYFSKVQTF